jgi:uncharacterized protein YkwD
VSLTRGRVTDSRDTLSPDQGTEAVSKGPYGETVVLAPAAAPARVALAAMVAISLVAFVVAGRADGAARSWSAYLAPASACQGSTDPAASPAVQQRAVACLVNWARAQGRMARLARPASLGRAAVLKGNKVASCGEFSHSPCGADPTAPLRAAGYRYATFGENLFLGTWGNVSARDAVAAWLRSPGHRANVLRPSFRHLGAALVRAPGMRGDGDGALWVTTFATPR